MEKLKFAAMTVDMNLHPMLDRVSADFSYARELCLGSGFSLSQLPAALVEFNRVADPFSSALLASLGVGILCYITSIVTKNHSVVCRVRRSRPASRRMLWGIC